MLAGLCTNLKSGMATSAGTCVKAKKSACGLLTARGSEFIRDLKFRSWGLLISCLSFTDRESGHLKAAAVL